MRLAGLHGQTLISLRIENFWFFKNKEKWLEVFDFGPLFIIQLNSVFSSDITNLTHLSQLFIEVMKQQLRQE